MDRPSDAITHADVLGDVCEDDAYFGSNRSVHGGTAGSHLIATMNTNAGIATLLRAACTSGDSNTVNAVMAAA